MTQAYSFAPAQSLLVFGGHVSAYKGPRDSSRTQAYEPTGHPNGRSVAGCVTV